MQTALLQHINQRCGTDFELRGRYPTGEQGAFAVTERRGDGTRAFVLKWQLGASVPDGIWAATAVTERLRNTGYPAPRYRLVGAAPALGVVYSIQDVLSGVPLGHQLDGPFLDQLLHLNDLQRSQARSPVGDWPRPLIDSVLHGANGFCLLESLRAYSVATAELLAKLQQLVTTEIAERPATADVVHFDFQGANILVNDGQVSGIVDWEGCCAGDAAFDLATLFFYANAADSSESDRIWNLLLARTGPPLLGIYLAHLVLRQVDWSIRFHRETVARWLERSNEVLQRLSSAATENSAE